jgi:hypothetical protein
MSILRTVTTTAFGLALMGAVFSPVANADDWNRKTVMTFSAPVEIPGVHLKGWGVLPAGTYVFKILDSQTDRHIVQIFNQDETQIYATILAIPNGSHLQRTAGWSAGSAPGMVLSRQKLGRGIRVSAGESHGVGQVGQHGGSVHGSRHPGGSRGADQVG